MKRLFLILLVFCATTIVAAQNIVFADANFKTRLISASLGNFYATTGWDNSNPLRPFSMSPVIIDINLDGEIQVNETQNITALNLSNANINDLSGIEYFTNLKGLGIGQDSGSGYGITTLNSLGLQNLELLYIENQTITSYSFLSNFPNLKILSFKDIPGNPTNFNWQNNIINLSYYAYTGNINISNLPNLIYLDCRLNNLTSLETSNNPNLQRVDCSLNNITNLDFSNNPQLNELACSGNNNLTTINIKNGTQQIFNPNAFYPHIYDNWSDCPNLNFICADSNEILDIQNLLAPNYNLQNITITDNCSLASESFEISNFNIYPNPTTNQVFFDNSSTQFSKVAVYNSMGQEIAIKQLDYKDKENINLENFASGIYLFKFFNDKKSILKKITKL